MKIVFAIALFWALYIAHYHFVMLPTEIRAEAARAKQQQIDDAADRKAKREKCLDDAIGNYKYSWSLACASLPTATKACKEWALATAKSWEGFDRIPVYTAVLGETPNFLDSSGRSVIERVVGKCSCTKIPLHLAKQENANLSEVQEACRRDHPL